MSDWQTRTTRLIKDMQRRIEELEARTISPETVERLEATIKLYKMTFSLDRGRDFATPAFDLLRDILNEVTE